ncbi:MAG: hypothetical protein ALECFALPRED_006604 [Alectoria fallacina]|uniref:Uncharacterized protein n=1 Tax=Alectoria fallacina TaxID=1903189 RepID=A0A8H3ENH7_9LECA|nr:MAG: hypothetical protein ALECFALPRED_006604 [Alectoria fallacina]
MTTAYPPAVHHSSTRLSLSETLSLLSAYLDATTTDPSLHPSAHLTKHGPVAPSSGPNTGLVLHNLRRVEAGLRGENLGEDSIFQKYGGDGLPELMPDGVAEDAGGRGHRGSLDNEQGDVEMEGEWQDKEEFEREQEVVQGDIGKRDNAVDDGFEEEEGVVPRVKATWGPQDREARKRAKKERLKRVRMENDARKQMENATKKQMDAEQG